MKRTKTLIVAIVCGILAANVHHVSVANAQDSVYINKMCEDIMNQIYKNTERAICDIAITDDDSSMLFKTLEDNVRHIDIAEIETMRNKFVSANADDRRVSEKISALTEAMCEYKSNLENCVCINKNNNGSKLRKLYIASYIKYLKK